MARSPDERYDKALELYKRGMKLVEIANQLNLPPGTVRRWKSTHKWDGERSDKKSERSAKVKNNTKPIDDGTKETMLNENLTHEQRLFCIYYSKIFNATQSYINAYKCDYETANANGSRLLVNASVRAEIQRLNELKRQQIVTGENDLVELHMRIAFSDIGNYLSFGKKEVETIDGETIKVNSVDLKESKNADTQIIQEVKQGRDGVSVKLADKQKSLDWLEKFFLMNPMDKHKIDYDNKKLEFEHKKIEPEQASSDGIKEFLKAIRPSEEDLRELFADEVIEDGEENPEE